MNSLFTLKIKSRFQFTALPLDLPAFRLRPAGTILIVFPGIHHATTKKTIGNEHTGWQKAGYDQQCQATDRRRQVSSQKGDRESVVFSADIIADGHDAVAASVIFRYAADQLWEDVPMSHAGNDHWHATWTPGKEGFYEYRFTGWVDHFTTWKKGLVKKFDASQDVVIELRIGADILKEAAGLALKDYQPAFERWIAALENAVDPQDGVDLALSDALAEAMSKIRYTDRISVFAKHFAWKSSEKSRFQHLVRAFPPVGRRSARPPWHISRCTPAVT
jgi:hypothetical protein